MSQTTTEVGQQSKISTQADNDKALRDAYILPGSTKMAMKKESGSFGQPIDPVMTNIYRLDALNKIVIYRYEVNIVGIGPDREVLLTESAASDFQNNERRYICHCVFNAFKQRIGESIANGQLFYYDQQRILFTLKLMDVLGEHTFLSKEIPHEEIPFERIHYSFPRYRLKIAPATDGFQLKLADFSHLTNDVSLIDRSVEQFLDVATAQEVFNDSENFINFSPSLYYMLNPSSYGFNQEDCLCNSSNSSFMAIGCLKQVRPIQAIDGTLTSGMVIQLKMTPFHINEGALMSDKVNCIVGNEIFKHARADQIKQIVEPLIKGIWVKTIYGIQQKFEIYAVSTTKQIQHKESEMPDLEYRNLPLLVRKESNRLSYYPMELCAVLDNQRVKRYQQTPAAIQEMIRHTTLLPARFHQQNTRAKISLQLDNSNYLLAAGLRFHDQPIEVKARQLPPPELQFGKNFVEKPSQPASAWQGKTYLVPARIQKWMAIAISAIAISDCDHDSITETEWRKFVDQFSSRMAIMGIQFPAPMVRVIQYEGLKLDKFFQNTEEYDYALFAHPDSANDVHNAMKYFEKETEVVTQGVKITTVKKVIGSDQPLIVANIVHKTNIKMGGLNYAMIPASAPQLQKILSLSTYDTLIIGFAINHPEGGFTAKEIEPHHCEGGNGNGSEGSSGSDGNGSPSAKCDLISPSVVGYAANIGIKNSFEFVGDYVYQAPLPDVNVKIISEITKRCIQQFQLTNQKSPERIVVFRDGCADFQNILKYEVPLMKKGMTDVSCQAKITLVVVNKLQPVRCYPKSPNPQEKAFEQNIKPGTVIDSDIVHPSWTNFFLNSHSAIHGTAAIPHYNLLIDENELSMDTLQMMTHNLCFGHQIVYSPTSLPSPVYIAKEYAKRGRNNFNYWINSNKVEMGFNDKYEQLTNQLSMKNSRYLKYMRVNA